MHRTPGRPRSPGQPGPGTLSSLSRCRTSRISVVHTGPVRHRHRRGIFHHLTLHFLQERPSFRRVEHVAHQRGQGLEPLVFPSPSTLLDGLHLFSLRSCRKACSSRQKEVFSRDKKSTHLLLVRVAYTGITTTHIKTFYNFPHSSQNRAIARMPLSCIPCGAIDRLRALLGNRSSPGSRFLYRIRPRKNPS
jgi:hypothetical protein